MDRVSAITRSSSTTRTTGRSCSARRLDFILAGTSNGTSGKRPALFTSNNLAFKSNLRHGQAYAMLPSAKIAHEPPLAVGYGPGKKVQSGESSFSLEWNNVDPAKV